MKKGGLVDDSGARDGLYDYMIMLSAGDAKSLATLETLRRDSESGSFPEPDRAQRHIFALPNAGILGEDIYILFGGVCGQSVGKMIALLRAFKEGEQAGVNRKSLKRAISIGKWFLTQKGMDGTVRDQLVLRNTGIDMAAAVKFVQEKNPYFQAENTTVL